MSTILGTTLLAAVVLAAGRSLAQETAPAQGETARVEVSKPAETTQLPASADVEQTRALTAEGTEPGDSHVRIVRLSEVRGTVVLDRNVGRGPEATMQNMPIAQTMALATGTDGFAEVEFEDGSSLRLAPDTEVRFPLLVLRSSGAKASTILVDRGMVYVSLEKTKDTEFTLAMGKARIAVSPGTHLRLDMTGPKAELAVISGTASVQPDGGAPVEVGKKQTMTLDRAGAGQTEVAKGIYESAYDEWDKDAVKYHQRYMKTIADAGSTALYGVSDLNYYGSFVGNSCGGSFWRPYFASAGWSPYSNGMWALYSSGYSWVSPYPWGWLPFHTGAWSFCPSTGWGWRPGGAWYGLGNITMLNPGFPAGGIAASGLRGIVHPPGMVGGPRPRPPAEAKSIVPTSNAPMVRSMMDRSDNFVFRRDSAGMGIPRGSLGGLHGISRDVERHGFATRDVYAAPMSPARSMMVRGTHADQAQQPGASPAAPPMTLRRGPTPGGMGLGGGDRFAWKNGQAGQSQQRQVNNAPGGFAHPQGGGGQPGTVNRGPTPGGFGGGQSGGGFNRGAGGPTTGGVGNGGAGRGGGPSPR